MLLANILFPDSGTCGQAAALGCWLTVQHPAGPGLASGPLPTTLLKHIKTFLGLACKFQL